MGNIMNKKRELQQRIVAGHQKINHLEGLAGQLPHGKKRDELREKSIRLLVKLDELQEGFCELYPGECLFDDKRCESSNKGTFHCAECPTYLNSIYSLVDERRLL